MALSELFTPLEWVFVIILGLVPLAGIVLHLWIMLLRPPKDSGDGQTQDTKPR
ncbi:MULTISPECIES: hypothetical protein [Vogesella]|uniref:Uncharacterized protein n=1 Tax=Vogesella aquatica TaxID=2984206 RepID=A0ABT5IT41_9NEIS|nr:MULTISPECIES: hypothetical protein [Vogesella]MBP7579413.1 hypothetical protein [Vogesella sp.]MDC7715735.1 hypothetical protein [Vogesella aquatica]UDM16280.1 hypothetical protein LCH97_13405 [Vogesella sp. XCS3]